MPNRYTPSHASPRGPGDSRPTAQRIIDDAHRRDSLPGAHILVTGASSGIGVPTVLSLATTGATVYATARNPAKARAALSAVLAPAGPVQLVEMDNTSLASVRAAARQVLDRSGGKLNILVCNAGVMETPYGKTADGFEMQFGTNHVAHFLLFQLLKDALVAGATPEFNSRVVMVSSMGHKYGTVNFGDFNFEKTEYTPMSAYGQSKTANIWMANQIEREYGGRGVHAYSLHPGGIMTGLQVHVDEERKSMWMGNEAVKNYLKSPEQGAATSVFAAVSREWEGKGGVYMEDCDKALPEAETEAMGMKGAIGYNGWCYSPEGEERLWGESLKLVGVQ